MPKKQTKPKYPKELLVKIEHDFDDTYFVSSDNPDDIGEAEVAIYKFVRLAKVKRTVTVE